MIRKFVVTSLVVFACLSTLFPSPSSAAYPERPIQLIIAYRAGGGSDRLFRGCQPFLEKKLGQSLLPIYKPGVDGVIGFTEIANASPNGYSVGILNSPSSIAPVVAGNAEYTVDSFTYLGNITYEPPILIVPKNNALNIKNLDDFIKYCKKNPGKVTVGISGIGSDEHIAIRLLQKAAGISTKVVSFDGTAAGSVSMLGGNIVALMTSSFAVLNLIKQGDVIVLGVGSEQRSKEFPNQPTFREQNVDMVLGGIRGIVGPVGMPEEARKLWIDAIKSLHSDPEYLEFAKKTKIMLLYLDDKQHKDFSQDMYDKHKILWDEEKW